MNRRRSNTLIACVTLVMAVAIVAVFGSRGGKVEVKVVFLGFTNGTVTTFISAMSPVLVTNSNTMALFLVTNAGSASLKFHDFLLDDGFKILPVTGSSFRYRPVISEFMAIGQVKPGQCVDFQFNCPAGTNIYHGRLGFRRVGLLDRMSGLCMSRGWYSLADALEPKPGADSIRWYSTGWITNPPAPR